MSELINSQQNNIVYLPKNGGVSDNAQKPDLNIQAHYSNDMKVKRTRKTVNDIPPNLPTHHLISPQELNSRMRNIDTDIYEGAKKEQSKHDFNAKLYFGIFGAVSLSAAIIACIRKFGK